MEFTDKDSSKVAEGRWAKLLRLAQLRGISPNAIRAAIIIAAVILLIALIRCIPLVLGSDDSFQIITATASDEDASAESSDADEEQSENSEELEQVTAASESTVVVHVAGAVEEPGVYSVFEGGRVLDAVEAAGGFSNEACAEAVNLARLISDGEQIYIPTYQEVESGEYTSSSSESSSAASGSSSSSSSGSLININTATADELDTLPGIGPVTASNIISYREENGGFSSKEEIKEVSGIGDAKYAQIEDLICV